MNDPKSTGEAFHQGWLKTGDVLRADTEEFFYLNDRKKELIKYKGLVLARSHLPKMLISKSFQVAPAELEGILITHPFVNEGVVCATWDDTQSTEVPIAYVTLTKAGEDCVGGLEVALHEIRKFVDGKVSPYKRLRGGVEILDEIPKTPMGKALRRLLPARLARARPARL
jgi:4-coumarate--CoA ligase